MNFLINIKDTIENRSKELVFFKNDKETTKNINEAKLFDDTEATELIKLPQYCLLKKENLKLMTVENDMVIYNKFTRKHLN